MRISLTTVLSVCFVAGVVVIGSLCAAYVVAHSSSRGTGDTALSAEQSIDREGAQGETHAVAVHPRKDPNLTLTVRQLLVVEPFFQTELRSQVPGVVRFVSKTIDDPVKRGEVLVALNVPDLEQDLNEKEAMVLQREQDVVVARATADNTRATVDVYRETIDLRKAEQGQAGATRDYRLKRYTRFKDLGEKGGILKGVIEEEERDYLAAEFALEGAAVAIRKAEADLREKESLVRIADADIKLKQTLVEVARKNRDKARAYVDFAQITAPYDGVVVKRNVDIGSFVPSAATGQSQPLMTVARTDIVTVVMKVPDNAAPYVTPNTEAIIAIDELPGVEIHGRVTRFSPSIQNQDRTMRVEVDLYNQGAKEYAGFVARKVSNRLAGLSADSPLGLVAMLAANRVVWNRNLKSSSGPAATLPVVTGREDLPRLLPGMSGYMRLNLQNFRDAYLIPSSAVFTVGGKPYLLAVKDYVTQMLPVRVQYNDGKMASVSVIVQDEEPSQGVPAVLRELTAEDLIILNRQAEIGDGKTVKATLEKW